MNFSHRHIVTLIAWICCAGFMVLTVDLFGAEEDSTITLNFPENVEVKLLIEYVSERLSINILFDEQIGNKRLTIKAPGPIPSSSLLPLLESALRMKGLALVNGDAPGWKQIIVTSNLSQISHGPEFRENPNDLGSPTRVLTQVYRLNNADPRRVEQLLKPFLSGQGANAIPITEHQLLIVTDFQSNIAKTEAILQLIDQPGRTVAMRIVDVRHQEASRLTQQINQLLLSQRKVQGTVDTSVSNIEVTHDDRTNQIIVVGVSDRLQEITALIASLDVGLDMDARIYAMKIASPARVDRVIKEMIGEVRAKRFYRSIIDDEAMLLVVTTTHDIHAQLKTLIDRFDSVAADNQNPVRFYKLLNAMAVDVLETLRSIEGQEGLAGISLDGVAPLPTPLQELRSEDPPDEILIPGATRRGVTYTRKPGEPATHSASPSLFADSVQTSGARITADVNTNSIIVIASPAEHLIYERLITTLDRRRPQVLIEVIIVTLDTTDGYSFGIEISGGDRDGDKRTFGFSSFGLSEVTGSSGQLKITPGFGFNGVVLNPDIADIVLRALKTNARSKVVSTPRVLVNDNATGTLTSVNEAPFTSVNASSTVSTTSFGGFVSAGTTVKMTPHISEGDHLQLEYSIELNSFTGQGAVGVPPPRQTNSVESVVTIPNGHTIVVGGLNRADTSETINSIPILGQIPLVEYLVGSRSSGDSKSTMFVFIRPIILRDDEFKDLRFFSEQAVKNAGLTPDYPTSEPLLVN